MKPMPEGISIIIPTYGKLNRLREVVEGTIEELSTTNESFEVIIVDDNPGNSEWPSVLKICAENPCTRAIKLSRNFGQHNALLCGIRAAKKGICVTVDDDMQHPPNQIQILLGTLRAFNADVVYGDPTTPKHKKHRNISSWIAKGIIQLSAGKSSGEISSFRAFKTDLRNGFKSFESERVSIDVLLSWSSCKILTVAVAHSRRARGVSGYSFRGLARHTVNMLIGFSSTPLRVASYMGVMTGAIGFAGLAFTIGNWALVGSAVPGFTFLATVITLFSGVQLICAGILGEYILRIYQISIKKPTYVIKTVSSPNASNN